MNYAICSLSLFNDQVETLKEIVLVTGCSGFLAQHIILLFLQQGYKVRTILPSAKKKREVLDLLAVADLKKIRYLDFAETDLTRDKNWDIAMSGCDYVVHIALPIKPAMPKDEMINSLILEGAFSVVQAAREAGVKRTVLTSDSGTVGYSSTGITTLITGKTWPESNEKSLTAYSEMIVRYLQKYFRTGMFV